MLSNQTTLGVPFSFFDISEQGRRMFLIASVPLFMAVVYSVLAFVGQDWAWMTHVGGAGSTSKTMGPDAIIAGAGRLVFVLSSSIYAFFVFREMYRSISPVQPVVVSDPDVKLLAQEVLDTWITHFNQPDLTIDGVYVGRETQKASDSTREMIALTLEHVGRELSQALSKK